MYISFHQHPSWRPVRGPSCSNSESLNLQSHMPATARQMRRTEPVCGNCTRKNRACLYGASPPGRGRIAAEGYAEEDRSNTRRSNTGHAFDSEVAPPVFGSTSTDKAQTVNQPLSSSFRPVVSQYITDQNYRPDALRTAPNTIHKGPGLMKMDVDKKILDDGVQMT